MKVIKKILDLLKIFLKRPLLWYQRSSGISIQINWFSTKLSLKISSHIARITRSLQMYSSRWSAFSSSKDSENPRQLIFLREFPPGKASKHVKIRKILFVRTRLHFHHKSFCFLFSLTSAYFSSKKFMTLSGEGEWRETKSQRRTKRKVLDAYSGNEFNAFWSLN